MTAKEIDAVLDEHPAVNVTRNDRPRFQCFPRSEVFVGQAPRALDRVQEGPVVSSDDVDRISGRQGHGRPPGRVERGNRFPGAQIAVRKDRSPFHAVQQNRLAVDESLAAEGIKITPELGAGQKNPGRLRAGGQLPRRQTAAGSDDRMLDGRQSGVGVAPSSADHINPVPGRDGACAASGQGQWRPVRPGQSLGGGRSGAAKDRRRDPTQPVCCEGFAHVHPPILPVLIAPSGSKVNRPILPILTVRVSGPRRKLVL